MYIFFHINFNHFYKIGNDYTVPNILLSNRFENVVSKNQYESQNNSIFEYILYDCIYYKFSNKCCNYYFFTAYIL